MLFALIGLAIAFYFMKISLKINSFKELARLIGVGILVALHWITFYKSIQLSTASLGILCLSTVTLHVTWLEPLIMKRKFSWLEFALGLSVIGGIYIVSSDFNSNDYEALAYGLTSAIFAALFSVFNGRLVKTIPATTMTFYELLAGFIFLSIILMSRGEFDTSLFTMTTSDFLWILFLGLVCTSFAFLVNINALKRLGAFTVSLSINLEPVYTILLAIVILEENKLLGPKFYFGSVLIVFVVILNAVLKRKD